MRELILKMFLSIDGFVSGPDGEIDWIFSGDLEAMAWSIEAISNASLHIMGSRTFRDMAAYWPTATDAFAPPMNRIPKAVFSKQGSAILNAAPATPPTDATRSTASTDQSAKLQSGSESWATAYVATGDLAQEIAQLKAQPGKPIIAHGGATFARSLVSRCLVDEYRLMIHPIALGRGKPIFAGLQTPRPFKLVSSHPFPSGAVAQTYRPA